MTPTLREILTPLIAYVLLFTRTPEEQKRAFADLRGRIEKLIAEQGTAVRRHDLPAQDYQNACFAVVAWLDETILRHTLESNRPVYDEWRRSPLQAALYGTSNAGQEFFDRLDRLNPGQKQLCEVYFLALSLGFRGKYYDDAQENQLIDLRRQCAARLPEPISDLLDFEKRQERITPEVYAVQPPSLRPLERRWPRYWLAAPIAGAAALVLLFLWLRGPDPAAIRAALQTFECSGIVVGGIEHGVVNLAGHVESDQQRDAVRQKIAGLRGVKRVSDDLKVIPRPFCEVMGALDPLQEASQRTGFNLKVQPSQGCSTTYYSGDKLIIDAIAARPLHYVYIDYYFADGKTVLHFFPNAWEPNNETPGSSLTVNPEESSHPYQANVSGPAFGLEMVTAVSSPKALFSTARPPKEDAEVYLSMLKHQLPADSEGSAAAYCFVTTQDKQ